MIVWDKKKFEVRKNDRDFQVGDILELEHYVPITEHNRDLPISANKWVILAKVTYVLPGGQFGIEPGYCVMGIEMIQ